MQRKSYGKKLEPLGRALQNALKRRKIPINVEERKMLSLWDKAVGPQIIAQTQPSHIKGKTLFVRVSTSVWMQQLHFLKAEIIERFNELAQKTVIANIFFTLGRIDRHPCSTPEAPVFQATGPILKKRDHEMISSCAESISDPELREIIKRVMTKEIIRRRLAESRKAR